MTLSPHRRFVHSVRKVVGVTPKNIYLYRQAFNHKSEEVESNGNNERLEFLGDSILGAVVAAYLFEKYPYKGEGYLTQFRSKLVSRKQLKFVAESMNLDALIKYNTNININTSSIMGDTLEAVIGAVYLDKGYQYTRGFIIKKLLNKYLDIDVVRAEEKNYKGRLIEYCQKHRKKLVFHIKEVNKEKYRSWHVIEVIINGEVKGQGEHFSKKNAEQLAAEEAYKILMIS